MPILVKLDDVLHERRMTLTDLSEKIGITLANLSVLKTGKARAAIWLEVMTSAQAKKVKGGLNPQPLPPKILPKI